MRRLLRTVRTRIADERGFTLPELLVATMIALLVSAAGMVVLQAAVRTQPQTSERAAQIQEGRTLMETLSRELRQGVSIENTSQSGFSILTYVDSATCGGVAASTAIRCWVSYSCAAGTCTRTEHTATGGGAAERVASGLLSADVFSYCERGATSSECDLPSASNPTYVGIRLGYPAADGGEGITLDDGVALRNYVPEAAG